MSQERMEFRVNEVEGEMTVHVVKKAAKVEKESMVLLVPRERKARLARGENLVMVFIVIVSNSVLCL